MAFVSIPGVKGKVYAPEVRAASLKKHPCKDCFSCQLCSDDRCNLCLSQKTCRKKGRQRIHIEICDRPLTSI